MTHGLSRLRQTVTSALNRVRGGVVILLYHRTAHHDVDPQLLCVAPEHFKQHLDHLRKNYEVLTLTQLASAAQEGRIPRRGVLVTFDDGYVDNLWYAKPLLEQYECPATVFVVSGYVNQDREMISDELERLILKPRALPRTLNLTISGKCYSWEIDTLGVQPVKWDVTQPKYPSLRHRCYHDLHRLLRTMGAEEREEILVRLRNWANDTQSARDDYRVMNADELRELAKGDLVDVGAHTMSHLFLGAQPEEIQRREVGGSKEQLETLLACRVSMFAYPYGGRDAVCAVTERIVREVGFQAACANTPALASPRTNIFLLPRLLVRDWNKDEFSKKLGLFFAL